MTTPQACAISHTAWCCASAWHLEKTESLLGCDAHPTLHHLLQCSYLRGTVERCPALGVEGKGYTRTRSVSDLVYYVNPNPVDLLADIRM